MTSHLLVVALGALSAVRSSSICDVNFTQPVCAVRGFSATLPCSYSHPPNTWVTQMLWCSKPGSYCIDPPVVYNSSLNTSSDFQFIGDNNSNCTLLIHNVQFNYTGEYKFRYETNVSNAKCTSVKGLLLQVADLKVSLIRLSGNGTFKQGDSLNLTCDVNCTHTSSQFVWSKNDRSLNASGPVLHFPALTARNSGNYTCTWKTNQTSGYKTFSLHVEGVLPQDSEWGVKYPDEPICAVAGFNVSLPCYYYYPLQEYNVTQKLWCSMNTNTDLWCKTPPYVYNSSSGTNSDFTIAGGNQSDCTLLIRNVQFNYSGKYKFRFITSQSTGKYTGLTGVVLLVADLKVSLTQLRINGTFKEGESLNLTCDVNCTHTSSQFVWSKNNQRLPESGPVLQFPALTAKDSGNYTCTWETNQTLGYKTISFKVEGENPDHWPVEAVVTSAVLLICLVILGAVIYKRRGKDSHQKDINGVQTQEKQLPQSNEEVLRQEEVTYATVFVNQNNLNNGCFHTKTPKEDISVIYSTVKIK